MAKTLLIIGVGAEGRDGLSQASLDIIELADELWGSRRLLAMWPDFKGKTVTLGKNLNDKIQNLVTRPPGQQIVILASGDPGFFGIAASVLKILPPEEMEIIPAVSCLQTAFARVKVPWQDAVFCGAHARPLSEVIGLVRRYAKVGILTDPQQSPAFIAQKLLAAGLADCRAVVLENLGLADEKITDTRLTRLTDQTCGPLNVLLLLKGEGWKPAPLLSFREDEAYRHLNGLITKKDVRLAVIGRLGLCETDTVWDIGAGSGAMSIEMAEMAWRGRVFAIEKDERNLACIRENLAHFGITNVDIVAGTAPPALEGLPSPDAVFIGGNSGRLAEILTAVQKSARRGCRVAATFAVLENMLLALNWMLEHGWQPLLCELRVSYGTPIAGGTRLVPQNPVYIVNGVVRPQEETCPAD